MFTYQAPTDLLKGKVILVTGAGDGIGLCAAQTYARYGARIILLGRSMKKLELAYQNILIKAQEKPLIVQMDLETTSTQDYQALAQRLKNKHGKLDGLLHNAGLLGSLGPIESIKESEWNQVMQVNLHSVFLLTQTLLPLLRNADKASVIFTSSSVGRKSRANWGAYAISKFAIEGLMQTLASEVNDSSIRANSINPGATRTSMRAKAAPQEDPTTLPTANQIMPLYLYLMGEQSEAVNGQALNAQKNE